MRYLRTRYAQSKHDTRSLSTFLARAALQHGYPIDEFEESVQPLLQDEPGAAQPQKPVNGSSSSSSGGSKKDTKKTSKQAVLQKIKEQQAQAAAKAALNNGKSAKGRSSSTPAQTDIPKGDYIIKADQYVKIARFLAEKKVVVPLELLLLLRRCISLRLATLRRFLPNPDLSTYTHEYFVRCLSEVGDILQEAREAALGGDSKEGTGKQEKSSSGNRFSSLADLEASVEQHELGEGLEEIEISQPVKPPKAASAANANFGLESSRDEIFMSVLTLFADMHDIRKYIVKLWTEYGNGKLHLITAALTTDAVLEMVRPYHDEVMERAMPFLGGDVESMVSSLIVYLWQQSGQGQSTMTSAELDDGTPLLAIIPSDGWTEAVHDALFMPVYWALLDIYKNTPNRHYVFRSGPDCLDWDDSKDWTRASASERWAQVRRLIDMTYTDKILLSACCADEGLMEHHFMDETTKSIANILDSRKFSHHAVFCATVWTDINLNLRTKTNRAYEDLRLAATQMKAAWDAEVKKPCRWTAMNLKRIHDFRSMLNLYVRQPDLINSRERESNRRLGRQPPKQKRMLMFRDPVMCGVILGRLSALNQDYGWRMADCSEPALLLGHLSYACASFGLSDPSTFPQWPDMELFFKIHSTSPTGDGRPHENLVDSYLGLLRALSVAPQTLAAMRRLDAEICLPDRNRNRTIKEEEDHQHILKDQTKLFRLLKSRVFGIRKMTVDISTFEALLAEMAAPESKVKKDTRATELRKSTSSTRTGSGKQYSILQLAAVMKDGVNAELPLILFGYVSFHARCADLHEKIRVAFRDDLMTTRGVGYCGCCDGENLRSLITAILGEAAQVERDIERKIRGMRGVRGMAQSRGMSELFGRVAEFVAEYLRYPDRADTEIRKMTGTSALVEELKRLQV
ncbi:hypothetical protein A4X13_0g5696 [Tilletia indica]|uniref:DUF6604 domain-containing protein n=1 Tax=Tilletia indica TaxID=43049 RepID=A0A177T8W4_9BASI|nr:hypothetical protein A4X13_0g5696 [Tilletia indica]